ncbi:tyrosine protein kinase, partial [Acinetobacter baumannii]
SAALLGDLSKVSGGLSQKSPADPEIEILRSRMVLGQVIQNLNLDINVKDNQSGLIDKLISQDKSRLEYRHESVLYSNQNNNLIIRELKVP